MRGPTMSQQAWWFIAALCLIGAMSAEHPLKQIICALACICASLLAMWRPPDES